MKFESWYYIFLSKMLSKCRLEICQGPYGLKRPSQWTSKFALIQLSELIHRYNGGRLEASFWFRSYRQMYTMSHNFLLYNICAKYVNKYQTKLMFSNINALIVWWALIFRSRIFRACCQPHLLFCYPCTHVRDVCIKMRPVLGHNVERQNYTIKFEYKGVLSKPMATWIL